MIRKATLDDLQDVRQWLEATGSGFLGNWSLIERGQKEGQVTVMLSGDDVIAFSLHSSTTIDIFEVREDRRFGGTGKVLARYILDEARRSGSWGMYGFCVPRQSLGFWKRVGFERVYSHVDELYVAITFPGIHELPDDLARTQIDFVLYLPDGSPYRTASKLAAIEVDGEYTLAEDYLEYAENPDIRLIITTEGRTLFDGKCKYAEKVGGDRMPPWIRVRYVDPLP